MKHTPVLLEEVIDGLELKANFNVVDCTLGDAGHSQRILDMVAPKGKLLGIDADPEAILRAKNYLHEFENRVIFVRDNFVNLKEIINKEAFWPVNAILMDLGWSTPQFEERRRGFSFQKDEVLDMRFGGENQENQKTAGYILNEYGFAELARIFADYGEEKNGKAIAEAIIKYRKKEKILKTSQLTDIILDVYREKFKIKDKNKIPYTGKIHPATKIFQALRMEVNNELEVLKNALPQAVEILEKDGRLAVISFHSLEDAIVKHYFKSQNNKTIKIITKKPITASKEEMEQNPKSRSAKLRIVQKL